MGNSITTGDANLPAMSTITARSDLPENGTERLKRFRWAKGKSGNPGGRPRKLPISEDLAKILGMPLPEVLHHKLEAAIKQTLPMNMSFAEGLALATCLEAAGLETGTKVAVVRDIRNAIEGRPSKRLPVPE